MRRLFLLLAGFTVLMVSDAISIEIASSASGFSSTSDEVVACDPDNLWIWYASSEFQPRLRGLTRRLNGSDPLSAYFTLKHLPAGRAAIAAMCPYHQPATLRELHVQQQV